MGWRAVCLIAVYRRIHRLSLAKRRELRRRQRRQNLQQVYSAIDDFQGNGTDTIQ
jgi:hypothetical protein